MSIIKTDGVIVKSKIGEHRVERVKPENVEESLRLIEDLKFFLATAPANWQENQVIRRYYLNNDEGFVSCVFWNNLYYITGTDIVRCCVYRMQKFGREVVERKKFEEGIFSDLRNLKCGADATLEMPKSEFLSFLYKNLCLKTQKKQKVFFWFSVPHDKLFADALERDLRREASGQPSTTRAVTEPALTFTYDDQSGMSLYDQVVQHVDTKRIDLYSAPSTIGPMEVDMDDDEQDDDEQNGKGHVTVDMEDQRPSKDKLGIEPQAVISGEVSCADADISSSIAGEADRSTAPTTNYSPQELIIEAANTGVTEYALGDEINPADLLTKEDDDFPLDYFSLEIEYPPHQEQQGRMINPLFFDTEMESFPPIPPTAGPFENPYVHAELPTKFMYSGIPPTSAVAPQPVQQPLQPSIPPPQLSVGKGHFITNGEYYATAKTKDGKQPRDAEDETSNHITKENTDQIPGLTEDQVPASNNSRTVNSGIPAVMGNVAGVPLQDAYTGFQGMGVPGMYPYMMPDFLYNNTFPGTDEMLYEQWMHMQVAQTQPNEMYMNAQAPFMGRSFTPMYRTTPTNPYMAISPYQSKPPNSSTAKNFPFYQGYYGRRSNMHSYLRGFPSIQATQPSSATRMHFVKHNKVTNQHSSASSSGPSSSSKASHISSKKKVMKPRSQTLKNIGRAKRIEIDTNSTFVSQNSTHVDNISTAGLTEDQASENEGVGSPTSFQNVNTRT
ncbi:homeodomain family transcription factor STE12 Ecym_8007 [Eremothecium cymbalariae DBVPG|uniref:Uncharacterized protein n=1 Tax=Eremothecium cymbalariae (strain CBS 270.75 / DBVPG 7215 / KCTC 17166 / NRRL Y-17582) TaxID=931890 RepID=G8JXX7_ERECY|nr:Hypothetical protein Ecym_8007 [Eremothecium cymbalariae DBVPG\